MRHLKFLKILQVITSKQEYFKRQYLEVFYTFTKTEHYLYVFFNAKVK